MASRFPPRDRSPHRYSDRRSLPSGPRGGDDANSIPLGREPPRGPKALIDSSRAGPFTPAGPRGRGTSSRTDYRDRDSRDSRESRDGPTSFRRDSDREWSRRDRNFDSRDSRPSFNRGRSRSPPLRDFRDSAPRDLDLPRLSRPSRDGPSGPLLSDLSPVRGGSVRGRGRGERERGRGRGFADDRDLFRRRSLSRDDWRDRDSRFERDRDRDRDRDRERDRENRERDERRDRFDRRGDDSRSERDERDRLSDRLERSDTWKKDRIPSRIEPRGSSVAATISPSTISPRSSATQLVFSKDEPSDASQKAPIAPASLPKEQNKVSSKQDSSSVRQESSTDRPITHFPHQPAFTEVPAFGSFTGSPRPAAASVASQPSAPGTTPSRGRTPSASTPAVAPATQNDGFGASSVRPPTCPRADRADNQQAHDVRNKSELSIRPGRPPPTSPNVPPTPSLDRREITPSTLDSHGEERSPGLSAQTSGPMSPAIGPSILPPLAISRAPSDISGSPVTQRRPSNTQTSPRVPFSNIPTGPRALQRPVAPRANAKGSNQWVRPGYSNRGQPAIPSGSPTKRDSHPDEKDATVLGSIESRREDDQHDEKSGLIGAASSEKGIRMAEDDAILDPDTGSVNMRKASPDPQDTTESRRLRDDSMLLPMLLAESSGEVSDDEDDLDEEDFNQGEQRFEKEMQALAAEIPPPPLEDPVVVGLLLKIQMLGMIAEGAIPASLDEPGAAIEIETSDGPPTLLPLPSKEANDVELSDAPAVADDSMADVPKLENLPFLSAGPPTPFSDMDSYQENLRSHERLKNTIRDEMKTQRKEISKYHADLREQYRAYYRPWRLAVDAMDRKKAAEEKKAVTPVPATPPSTAASAAANPILEGRRGYRMNSELDFQLALKASTITAEEENARRRDQEPTARPDLSREAPIPDMLDPVQKEKLIFQDTNQVVDPAMAFEVFSFNLPPDDFTPDEHKIFTDTFMSHPKKWGKIAQAIPGRTFQQCINHYYLTKEEMKYKAKLNKRYVRKRGKKPVSRPPRSNALMADLGVVRPLYEGDDAGESTPAVTDTGRPRRAAAPTFGDNAADTETSTPTPTSGKRNNGKDGTDQSAEKPARRGGRGGNRGGRRTRTQNMNHTPIAAAPPKTAPEPITESAAETIVLKPKDEPEKVAAETAPLRAKSSRSRTKEVKETPPATSEPPEGDSMSRLPEPGGYGSQQPTSYWSVPEQRDFPDLVAHFGRDFEGISQFMKTKTPTMVRNYFQRAIDQGKSELEDLALAAEAKKQKGEPTGPLPVPSQPTKRRYDAIPSVVGPRPLAPNTENELGDRIANTKSKPGVVPLAAAPPAIQPRQPVEKGQPQQAFYPGPHVGGPQIMPVPSTEDPQQRGRVQNQRQHGPRLGYFSESRSEIRPAPAQVNIPGGPLQEMELKRQQSQSIASLPPGMHPQGISRHNVPPDGSDVVYQQVPQSSPFSQPSYLQPRSNVPPATMSQPHSRRPSRGVPSTAASPQPTPRMEPNLSSADMLGQSKIMYRQPSQYMDINRLTPSGSPQKELSLPNSMQGSGPPEPPRQVPAKRSNIMSILNDEPEDPQPRKRFASPRPASPRPAYKSHALPAHSSRSDDANQPYQRPQYTPVGSRQPQVPHSSQQQQPHSQMSSSQAYSGYSGHYGSSSSGGSLNQDWAARFDPRGQQQSQVSNPVDQHVSRLTRQPSASHIYTNTGRPHSATASTIQPMAQQQPPPSSQHQSQRPPFAHQVMQQPQPMHIQGQQSSSSSGSPMSQHLQQTFSRPGSPPIQRHSISYASKSSHPRPASPIPPSSSLSKPPQQSPRFASYTQSPSHQVQPAMENSHHPSHLYRQPSAQGAPSQQYGQSIRRVPSLSPRHQPSHLPSSQHALAQQEIQSQRAHRASFSIGQQATPQFHRNPPPAHTPSLSRTAGIPMERSYTPPSGLSQHISGPGGNASAHMYASGSLVHSQSRHMQQQGRPPPQQQQTQHPTQQPPHSLHQLPPRHPGGGSGSGMDHHMYDRR
ncbi:hypothetical protein LOZ58_000696 [Ophidiomyces ophidiicola]|nr:hypothetical protein LOZ58_000696 [Ophidiomyces ophidiicola]